MMLLKDCQIYDLKKSTLNLDLDIEAAKKDIQDAIQRQQQAEAILKELSLKDVSYLKIKKRVHDANKDLKKAGEVLEKLESEYDQKLMDQKFEFIEKVPVDRKVIHGPDYKLKWGSLMQDKSGASFASRWKELYGATYVTPKDKVWVVGAAWTGECFKHRDAVLVKIPLEVYIEKRRREVGKSLSAKEQKRRAFQAEGKAAGTKVYSPEELADLGL
jgi:hypothetical protein